MIKSAIVTGATGFIGRNLIRYLSTCGVKVYAVVRNKEKAKEISDFQSVTLICLQMSEYNKLVDMIHDDVDVLFHCAWNGVRDRNNEVMQKENFEYSKELISSCMKLDVKQFVLFGSQDEYGNIRNQREDEHTSNHLSHYAKAKIALYEYASEMIKQNGYVYELRVFSLYGENDSKETLIQKCELAIKKNAPINISKGTNLWNYLYIEDACKMIYQFVCHNPKSGIYNIASNETKELKEYVNIIKEAYDSNDVINFDNKIPVGKDLNPSIEKIRSVIQFSEFTSFSEGIKKIFKC